MDRITFNSAHSNQGHGHEDAHSALPTFPVLVGWCLIRAGPEEPQVQSFHSRFSLGK